MINIRSTLHSLKELTAPLPLKIWPYPAGRIPKGRKERIVFPKQIMVKIRGQLVLLALAIQK